MTDWFAVDKEGLAKLLERRGKAFAVLELIQNAWDANGTTKVDVTLHSIGRGRYELEVIDDSPDGFADLAHAYTLFAESTKKHDPTKRGRFNLGEKLVLALCTEARVVTTTGAVIFDKQGRHPSRLRREKGSAFTGTFRMTAEEESEIARAIQMIIPPVPTSFNGNAILQRLPIHEFEVTLPTEIADAEGVLRKSARLTKVRVYEPLEGETPTLYEMGIPVVETGDKWHVDVGQKIPLNMDRDNVTPGYLRQIRTWVVNEMHERLTEDDANAGWVREATSDLDIEPAAVEKVMDLRFGEKRVAYDPSDPEANKRAVAEGYTVVHGGMLNKTEWDNAKRAGVIKPAGQVTPSPKPFVEGGTPLKLIDPASMTPDMVRVVHFAKWVAKELIGHGIEVEIANDTQWPFGAVYGGAKLILNYGRLGKQWFANECWSEPVLKLLLHELAHEFSGDHLSEQYHEAICLLGAKLALLAMSKKEK